jgi:DNA-binding NarL/FixJ family response regulator
MAHGERTVCPAEPSEFAEQLALGAIWRALSRGELVVHRILSGGLHTVVVFVERSPNEAAANALSEPSRGMLERVLDGTSLKVIAAEAGLSLSAVSTRCSSAAKKLGVPGRIAALPVVLAELRCADRVNSPVTAATYRLWGEDDRYLVLIAPGADAELARQLPPAEFETCQLFLHGLSHRQIAQARRTSVRTTANQLRAVFRRFGISGRLQLLARAASASIAETALAHGASAARLCRTAKSRRGSVQSIAAEHNSEFIRLSPPFLLKPSTTDSVLRQAISRATGAIENCSGVVSIPATGSAATLTTAPNKLPFRSYQQDRILAHRTP